MNQASYDDFGKYHPLFLPDDGSTEADMGPPVGPKELKMLQVTRIERGEEVKVIPGRVDPGELRSEEDIFARWGAGTYVVTARTVGGFVYAKRKFVLRDPSAPNQPAQQPQVGAFPTMGISGNDGVILAVLQMMNQNMQADRDREARMAQERERSQRESSMMMMQMQQQQTQMLVAVLGNAGNTQSEMMRQTMALMANAKQGGAGAGDSIKALQGVYDLAKTMAPKASGDGFDWSQIAQLVGGFLGGMAEASKNAQPPLQTVTVQAEPVQQAPAPAMGPNGEPPAG